jgi:hypothetical protein
LEKYSNSNDSKKISTLKNTHVGERCFIVGNGPSLTTQDLDMIAGEDSFGVNKIFQLYNKTKWCQTYYCCCDKDAWMFCKNFFENNFTNSILLLDMELKIDNLRDHPSIYRFHGAPRFSLKRHNYKQFENILFAENLQNGVYMVFTVVIIAIQFAIYMGYKEIYLLGADCNYSGDPQKNYPKEMTMNYAQPRYDEVNQNLMRSYSVVKEYAESHSIKILNATRGGKLELFERVDLDTLLNGLG